MNFFLVDNNFNAKLGLHNSTGAYVDFLKIQTDIGYYEHFNQADANDFNWHEIATHCD